MKISNGFVTNSSSTSFVISTKNGLTKEKFLKAMGVTDESLLFDLYEKLYYTIKQNLNQIPTGINILEFIKSNRIFIEDEHDLQDIKKRYENGETVYYGSFSDSGEDGGRIEAFYSHESIVVIGEDIYFNSRNSVY